MTQRLHFFRFELSPDSAFFWLVRKSGFIGLVSLVLLGLNSSTRGQSSDLPSLADNGRMEVTDSSISPEELAEKREKLLVVIDRLRDCVIRARVAEFQYFTGKGMEESEDWHSAHEEAIVDGKKIKRDLIELAYPIIIHSPHLDDETFELGKMMMFGLYDDYQYEKAYQAARRLNQQTPAEDLELMIMRSAMLTNRFNVAAEFREKVVSKVQSLPKLELSMLKTLPELMRIEAEEAKWRHTDEKNNLPQVELMTSEGTVVVELYEDQYPDTVGHFMFLVEQGFYSNLVFHRVSKNYLPFSIVQTGQFSLQDVEGAVHQAWYAHDIGYKIHDELPVNGAVRRHLRGVLSLMVMEDKENKRVPDSAGSQFIITLVPSPALDGHQVAFGRVISGMEYLDQIQPTFEISEKDGKENPLESPEFTTIIKATVLRKRDHEYKPNRVIK